MIIETMEAQPAAYSCRKEMTFGNNIPEIELKARTSAFLSELTLGLKDRGCNLIGHIKGLVDAGNNGHLMFSITSFEDEVHFKGQLKEDVISAVLTVNIIVYGIEKRVVEAVFQKALDHAF